MNFCSDLERAALRRRIEGWSGGFWFWEYGSMQAEEIFLAALDKQTLPEREAFLDTACGDNARLRAHVEGLLDSHEEAGSFLDAPLFDSRATIDHSASSSARPATLADEIPLDFLAPPTDPDTIGRIGSYDVTEPIGRGGMGVVLKARDAKLNRVVAIKVMAPELASNPMARKRFVREAQAAAAVVHQHVVTIHAVDEDRLPYLVMEYIDGQSLQEKIDREGHLKVVEILRIGQQVASGLEAAHAHGLMHRDVKPANILLENGVERVRITDFGLARAVDDVGVTRTGEVSGTPQYMSPEQAQGLPMDARSDLFSLGCVLYSMCTGRPPFRAETVFATARRVCEDKPRPIREINPEIPEWLVAIIDRLLAKTPTERFQTAVEVAALLGQHLAHLQHPLSAPLPVIDTATKKKHRAPAKLCILPLQRLPVALAGVALVCLAVSLGLAEATGVTHLGATVIRILTPSGTLVVETDDFAVKVTVEGDGGLVITGAGPHEVRLKPGSYKLLADKNGQPVPLERELVSIAKGGREVVRVKLEAADTKLAQTAQGFVPLFDGKDLTGWNAAKGGTGMWRIEDGALTCTGPMAHLMTIRDDFGDFHLRAEVKINASGNSGIYFRTGQKLAVVGDYEAQITNNPGQPTKTGSLFGLDRVSESPVPPNTWFTLEIIAVGKRIRVLVNGTKTADYTENRADRNTKGHIALQHHDPETSVFFHKIEIKEMPPNKSAVEGAFVVIGGQGVPERKFDTLADAVIGASDGDTIEIRGNGPFVSPPVNIGNQALTIRAGEAFRPVIQLNPEGVQRKQCLLTTTAALVLEGLDLQHREPSDFGNRVLETQAPLWAANCKFRDAVAINSPLCVFRNCEARCVFGWPRPGARWTFENCLLRAKGITLMPHYYDASLHDVGIQIKRSTVVSSLPSLNLCLDVPLDARQAAQPIRLDVSGSVFGGPNVLGLDLPQKLFGKGADPQPAEAEATLLRLLKWQGEHNLFAAGSTTVWANQLGQHLLPPGPKRPEAWKRFWGGAEVDSLEGGIRFQGGNLLARMDADLDQLTPGDFRLRPDSVGYGAGNDGKDLGADLDLVGPGAAYERWKKTPEHQQWLKDMAKSLEPDRKAAEYVRSIGANAIAHVSEGRLDEAAKEFSTVLDLTADSSANDVEQKRIVEQIVTSDEVFPRVFKLRPKLIWLWSHRAHHLADQRRWDEAEACFRTALELGPDGAGTWSNYAVACLAANHPDAYRQVCEKMLQEFGEVADGHEAWWASWAMALAPHSVKEKVKALRLAERTMKGLPNAVYGARPYAAWLYRLDRLDGSVACWDKAGKDDFEEIRICFLAMAHHRLGNSDLADRFVNEARSKQADWSKLTPWYRRAYYELIAHEMEEVLSGEPD